MTERDGTGVDTVPAPRGRTTLFPVFLKLAGRRVVVVGGGPVAASKLASLIAAKAAVTVVAPEVVSEIERLPVTIERRPFRPDDLDGAWFVVAAAPTEVNRDVSIAAEQRAIFVNAVDDMAHATAYLGGVVRRDSVTVAISTDGRAPALAGLMREAIAAVLPTDLDEWLATSDRARLAWKSSRVPMEQRRPLLLEALNGLYAGRVPGGVEA
jgi:uroporphyrin-III C-methyltransferase/precorrin-2 dehydrogenase/sirohydrochlorin ferrochelatase